METLLSYKSDDGLKTDLLKEVKKHEAADQIVQGHYGKENGKWTGCAVGCAIHSLNLIMGKKHDYGDHSVYESEFGIPRIIARLQDRIFEGLPKERAKKFPFEFLSAVPIGKDLNLVWRKFLIWLLIDEKEGVIRHAKTDQTKKSITDVADLLTRSLTEKITDEQYSAVRQTDGTPEGSMTYTREEILDAVRAEMKESDAASAYDVVSRALDRVEKDKYERPILAEFREMLDSEFMEFYRDNYSQFGAEACRIMDLEKKRRNL